MQIPPARDILAGLGAFAAFVVPLVLLKFHSGKFPVDIAVYKEAGRVVFHGGNPYASDFGQDLRIQLPFTYPPFAALLCIPLAALSKGQAITTWTAVSLAILAVMAWLVVRPALDRPGLPAASLPEGQRAALMGAIVGVLAWTIPVSQTLAFGQVNLPLAFACLLDCTWTTRRRGVLVGVATAVKLTPGIFVLYFAATRQWAAAVRAALAFAVCELVAAVILPGPSRQYWFHLAFSPGRTGHPNYFTNQSIYGSITRLNMPVWLWPPLALAVGVFGLWRATRAHRAGTEVAAVAIVGLTAVLVSPISWQHHAVWIIFVIAVLAAWATTPWRAALSGAVLGIFVFPFPWVGRRMLSAGDVPVLAKLFENSYAVAFLALILLLPFIRVTSGGPELAPRQLSETPP